MAIAQTLTKRPWTLAVLIIVVVSLWLASGMVGRKAAPPVANPGPEPAQEAPRVQVRSQQAEPVTRFISVYGRTAPARQVDLKAETSGRVSEIGLDRGHQAQGGELILRLDLRDRQARLDQARASVNEADAAYRAQVGLKAQGYVSDTQLAETLAKLEGARAELKRAELDLDYMNVRAPFQGSLQDRTVEIGDYVKAGDPVATYVDNLHLIVTGSIAEQDASHVRVGQPGTAVLVTGEEVQGRIRYIAPVADESTRTFTVELEVPNPGGKLAAGVTAEMRIPAGETLAHRISPALLTLDSDGKLGVKVVDRDNRAVFYPVAIARSESNGVWVTGLPESASIIVVGQGYVSAGQQVAAVEAQTAGTAVAAGQGPSGH